VWAHDAAWSMAWSRSPGPGTAVVTDKDLAGEETEEVLSPARPVPVLRWATVEAVATRHQGPVLGSVSPGAK
jgi:hypothetical protein